MVQFFDLVHHINHTVHISYFDGIYPRKDIYENLCVDRWPVHYCFDSNQILIFDDVMILMMICGHGQQSCWLNIEIHNIKVNYIHQVLPPGLYIYTILQHRPPVLP